MEEIELKPCPFCGGEAEINVDREAVEDTENGIGRIPWYAKVLRNIWAYISARKAREAWNRRADNG